MRCCVRNAVRGRKLRLGRAEEVMSRGGAITITYKIWDQDV